jgi:hypothetical protein
MAEETSKEPEAEENHGLNYSPEQYDILKRCSEKKNMTEWKEWREKHLGKEILLEGADLLGAWLRGVDLSDYRGIATQPTVHLKNATLIGADLELACLVRSDLQYADLSDANLAGAELNDAILKNANFQRAQLNGRLSMGRIYIRGTCFDGAQLENTDFKRSIVDSSTSFWTCMLNQETDFREVAFGSVQLEQGKTQLLEYNSRRMNWEDWYQEHTRLKWAVRPFWWMSDYGLSTGRIVTTFFILAFVFAVVYRLWPSFVIVNEVVGDIRGFWHALYFSVVTMTTLGFGDIAANPDSWGGQTLLMLQVILGYVLLGALVTRFAVLFTAGGPAGKFVDE